MTATKIQGNGAGGRVRESPRIEPPARRRGRLPEVAVGVIIMVGFALAAVLWHMSSTSSEPALALAVDVNRGDVIEASDLRVVYLSSDGPIAHLPDTASAELVGKIAVADIPAGTLLTRSDVGEGVGIEAGEGVVGLALDPGQFPAPGLLPGDVVNVVPGSPAAGSDGEPEEDQVLAARAEVFAVEEVGTQGRLVVSLKMPEAEANVVAAAAERGPIRLVLVSR